MSMATYYTLTMGRPSLLKNVANMYLMKDGTPASPRSPARETMQLPGRQKPRQPPHRPSAPGYKRIDDDKRVGAFWPRP